MLTITNSDSNTVSYAIYANYPSTSKLVLAGQVSGGGSTTIDSGVKSQFIVAGGNYTLSCTSPTPDSSQTPALLIVGYSRNLVTDAPGSTPTAPPATSNNGGGGGNSPTPSQVPSLVATEASSLSQALSSPTLLSQALASVSDCSTMCTRACSHGAVESCNCSPFAVVCAPSSTASSTSTLTAVALVVGVVASAL